jgi:hypothetical protein
MITEIYDKKYLTTINFLLNNIFSFKFEDDEKIPLSSQLSLNRDNLIKLKKYNYNCYIRNIEKYKRGVLFFFLNKHSDTKTVIVDENFKFYSVDIKTMDEYHKGTVIEILFNNENVILVDSYCVSYKNTMRYNFSDRQLELDSIIHNIISPLTITLVDFKKLGAITDVNKDEELILVPEDLPIKFGLNYSYFIWRNSNNITFNLSIMEKEDCIDLYTTNFKQFKLFAKINDKLSEDVLSIKNLNNYKDNCVVEFKITENKLIATKVLDKKYPSNIRVIERAILNKNEKIELKDIIN